MLNPIKEHLEALAMMPSYSTLKNKFI